MTSETLRDLLRQIMIDSWQSDAGSIVIGHLGRLCRIEAARWRSTAGSLDEDGLSLLWETVDGLLRKGEIDSVPAIIALKVRKIYAGLAAAVQTGFGSPTTRGLVELARHSDPLIRDDETLAQQALGESAAGGRATWLEVGGELLEAAGWAWVVPAGEALEAAAACGVSSRRQGGVGAYRRSPLAGHETGVPADSWSSLELLALGSTPGCQPEHRWPGLIALADDMSADELGHDREIARIVAAAVAGRAARSGRRLRA